MTRRAVAHEQAAVIEIAAGFPMHAI